jgi:stress response protein YsnF
VSDKKRGNNPMNIDFNDMVGKEAIGIDGLDLGKVIEIGKTFIVTQRGLIDKKKYHLPISSVESFDGDSVNFKISDNDLTSYQQSEKNNFEGYSTFKSSDMSGELQTTIPLIDEKLDVSKKTVEENIKIIKEPTKKTISEQINLSYDMITLIKRPVVVDSNGIANISNNNSAAQTAKTVSNKTITEKEDLSKADNTEIIVALEREEPVITKRSYMREEIIVKKESVIETKTITEQVIHEQIKTDDSNNILDGNR